MDLDWFSKGGVNCFPIIPRKHREVKRRSFLLPHNFDRSSCGFWLSTGHGAITEKTVHWSSEMQRRWWRRRPSSVVRSMLWCTAAPSSPSAFCENRHHCQKLVGSIRNWLNLLLFISEQSVPVLVSFSVSSTSEFELVLWSLHCLREVGAFPFDVLLLYLAASAWPY